MDKTLGELVQVPLRELWPHEGRDFSSWLASNLDRLGQALGLRIEDLGREVSVGEFSADIVARDVSRNRRIIIENQLGRTNHDHLGKLITYAAGTKSSVIIWISPEFREEHRSAIDWLNDNTDESVEFFGIQIEALRIDNSRPAPNFKVVASPNNWLKDLVPVREDIANKERSTFLLAFNTKLAQQLKENGFLRTYKPGPNEWLVVERWPGSVDLQTAFSWTRYTVVLRMADSDAAKNHAVFAALEKQKIDIETLIGFPLTWNFRKEQKQQTILAAIDGIDRDDEESLQKARDWAVATLKKFKQVFEPRVADAVAMLSSRKATVLPSGSPASNALGTSAPSRSNSAG